ncbi:MAG TPA: hypothetical protein VFC78_08225 [Tepidisphaeraceae bacterium]|nr:hypothetical protein [Tepidisphaeraceae bacterium]
MKSRTKHRFIRACLTLCTLIGPIVATAGTARATDDDLSDDARLVGYEGKHVVLDAGSAPSYMLLFALGVVGLSVMFKSAKRTHLD